MAEPDEQRPDRLPGVDPEDLAAGHETSDASVRAVVGVGIGLLVVIGIAFVAITLLVGSYAGQPLALDRLPGLAPQPTPVLPPEPRLQVEPAQELRQYLDQQEQRLHSYGWVDRQAGVVRIPIDRAIDLLAQRGLPARPADAEQQYRDRADRSPSDASAGRVEEPTVP